MERRAQFDEEHAAKRAAAAEEKRRQDLEYVFKPGNVVAMCLRKKDGPPIATFVLKDVFGFFAHQPCIDNPFPEFGTEKLMIVSVESPLGRNIISAEEGSIVSIDLPKDEEGKEQAALYCQILRSLALTSSMLETLKILAMSAA